MKTMMKTYRGEIALRVLVPMGGRYGHALLRTDEAVAVAKPSPPPAALKPVAAGEGCWCGLAREGGGLLSCRRRFAPFLCTSASLAPVPSPSAVAFDARCEARLDWQTCSPVPRKTFKPATAACRPLRLSLAPPLVATAQCLQRGLQLSDCTGIILTSCIKRNCARWLKSWRPRAFDGGS